MKHRRTDTIEAADGTPLAFHVHGRPGRPVVVLTNGIGTTENFWRHLVTELAVDHTVVHWDYRGHGRTPVSRSGVYSMHLMADDLARVTRHVRAPSGPPPVHVAFSMGVAVLLECYRDHPQLVRGMALVAGSPDAPGTGVGPFRVPGVQRAAQALALAATPVVPLLSPLVKAFLRSRLPVPVAMAAGVVERHAPREDLDEFLEGVASMDLGAYWATLRALLAHRGSDVLARVKVPVAVVAAANDRLMPLRQVEHLRAGLPHARFTLIEGAGHAGLVERGPDMAAAVRALVDEAEAAQR